MELKDRWAQWDLKDPQVQPELGAQRDQTVCRVLPEPPGRRDWRDQLGLKDLKAIPALQERPVHKDPPDQLVPPALRDQRVTLDPRDRQDRPDLRVRKAPRGRKAHKAPPAPRVHKDLKAQPVHKGRRDPLDRQDPAELRDRPHSRRWRTSLMVM